MNTNNNVAQKKSPILAAVLSFLLGGLGQVYNGQPGKGLLIFFTGWLIIPWIYGIIDAYRTANKINEGIIVIQKRPGCVIATIIFMIIMPFLLAILGILAANAIPGFVKARHATQKTEIQAYPYWTFGGPKCYTNNTPDKQDQRVL